MVVAINISGRQDRVLCFELDLIGIGLIGKRHVSTEIYIFAIGSALRAQGQFETKLAYMIKFMIMK